MRTADFSDILYGAGALAGIRSAELTADTDEFALFRTFIDRRLRLAWEIHAWPEICRTEQRTFRAPYDATQAAGYVATDEVLDVASLNYFQALINAPTLPPTTAGVENSSQWAKCASVYQGNDWATGTVYTVTNGAAIIVRNPADNLMYQCITAHTAGATFDATKFGLLTPFQRYVGYEQTLADGTALTAIGDFLFAWDRDPRVTTKTCPLAYTLTELGAVFTTLRHAYPYVWLKYRLRRPVLTGEDWSATTIYTSGRQVYYLNATTAAGNFYTANTTTVAGESPVSAAAKWDVVELPYTFREYLVQGAYADWLTSDGQGDKAAALEGMAGGLLELEADKLQRQQGQVNRLNFRPT